MNEQDKKLMDILLANPDKYKIWVDNDCIHVDYAGEDGEHYANFSEFGYHLLNEMFQYLGLDSELV